MTSHDHVHSEWQRIVRLAERGDNGAIQKMSELVHAVLDVRGSFLQGDHDAHHFAHEIVTLQTESIIR